MNANSDLSGLLVVAPDRRVARRAERVVLAVAPDGGSSLWSTTFVGLAIAIVAPDRDPDARLWTREERLIHIRTLAQDHDWGSLQSLARPRLDERLGEAFIEAIADAIDALRAHFVGVEEILTHAGAAGVRERWEPLARLVVRYEAIAKTALGSANDVLVDACAILLRHPVRLERLCGAWPDIVVLHAERLTAPTLRLLTALAGGGARIHLHADGDGPRARPLGATDWWEAAKRRLPPPPSRGGRLMEALHGSWPITTPTISSGEGGGQEVMAGTANPNPTPPNTTSPNTSPPDTTNPNSTPGNTTNPNSTPGYTTSPNPTSPNGDTGSRPVLRRLMRPTHPAVEAEAIVAWLRAQLVAGRPSSACAVIAPTAQLLGSIARVARRQGLAVALEAPRPAVTPLTPEAAWALWSAHGAELAEDPEGLEAVMSALGQAPGALPEGGAEPGDVEAVTLTTIDRVHERQWPLVVIAGCVDGRFPATNVHIPFFDPQLVEGPDVASLTVRAAALRRDERRRFDRACAAATDQIVAVSAPAAGELISRFVEGWPPVAPPPLEPPPHMTAPIRLAVTANGTPVHPTGVLRLSATQLDGYSNCPWNYAVQYGLGVRGKDSVSSRFGTLVHSILENFLAPATGSGPSLAPTPAGPTPTRPTPAAPTPAAPTPAGDTATIAEAAAPTPQPRTMERLLAIAADLWDEELFDYRPQAADYRRRLDDLLTTWFEREGATARPIRTEYRFEFSSGEHTVVGSIDRIDFRDGPDGRPGLEIIDYKTGHKPSKATLAANLQLPLYYLASVRDPSLVALGHPSHLRLAFLAGGTDVALAITDDLAAVTESRIATSAREIVAEHFDPSVTADCQYCDLKRICPLQPEGREVP